MMILNEDNLKQCNSFLSSAAIIFAMFWSFQTFYMERNPAIKISHKCDSIRQEDGSILLRVYVSLENVGNAGFKSDGELRVLVQNAVVNVEEAKDLHQKIKEKKGIAAKTALKFDQNYNRYFDWTQEGLAYFQCLGEKKIKLQSKILPGDRSLFEFNFFLEGLKTPISIYSILEGHKEIYSFYRFVD